MSIAKVGVNSETTYIVSCLNKPHILSFEHYLNPEIAGGSFHVARSGTKNLVLGLQAILHYFSNNFFNMENLYLKFTCAVIFLWILLQLIATLTNKLQVLSIKKSIQDLMTTKKRQSIDFLDVFRTVAISWVILNHLGGEGRLDVLDRLPTAKLLKQSIHNNLIFGALIGNSALGVEIFLVLSGLLAAISWNRHALMNFKEHYAMFIIRRVFRLCPIVAVYIFIATGPLAKVMFYDTMISSCDAPRILSHLTLTSNWQQTPTCLGYLWYLGLDMQMYLVAPFLLHLLNRHLKFTIGIMAVLMCGSCILRAWICQIHGVCNSSDVDIPFVSFPGQDFQQMLKVYAGVWEMYGRPQTKCGPFLIGLLIGHLLSSGKISFKLSNLQFKLVFYSALIFSMAVIYAILPEYWHPEQGNTLYNTLYTALFRTLFAGAIGVMILALLSKNTNSNIHNIWSILAKLSFNVYLIHMPIMYLFNFVGPFQRTQSVYGLILVYPFAIGLSFLLALWFHIFIEAPISRLNKTYLKL